MVTRRSLLQLSALTGILLAAGAGSAGGMFFARPDRKESPRTAPERFGAGGMTLVGAAPAEDVDRGVEGAVALLGGWEKLDLAGRTVLVKPNVVSDQPSPATTSPAVLGAVVRALYRNGAKRVLVGDMSALQTLILSSTRRNMEKNGLLRAAQEAGGEVVTFEKGKWIEVPLPGARYVEKALVSEWLFRADRVVNLPVIKTHRSASYTLCLKNFIGCTHLRQRPYLVDRGHWEELIAEFNLAFRFDLHLADGTVAMISGGPWEGTPAPTGLILAGEDPVAVDAVGLGILKTFGKWEAVAGKGVWEQRQLRRARELGLGRGAEEIRLKAAEGNSEFQNLLRHAAGHAGIAIA